MLADWKSVFKQPADALQKSTEKGKVRLKPTSLHTNLPVSHETASKHALFPQLESPCPLQMCRGSPNSNGHWRERQPPAAHKNANPPFVPPTPPAHGTTSSLALKPLLSVCKICLTLILVVSSGGGYGALSPSLPHHNVTFFHPSRAHSACSATCTPFGTCATSSVVLSVRSSPTARISALQTAG